MLVVRAREVHRWRPSLSTRLRCSIAVLSLVGAALADQWPVVAPAVLLVVVLELVADRFAAERLASLLVSAVVVAVVCVVVVPWTPMVLPLLLVPAYRAGEQHGGRVALLLSLAVGVGPLVSSTLTGGPFGFAVQWWVLAVLLGQLGAWGARVEREQRWSGVLAAREAGQLLGRLQDLARTLPAGFDVQAVSASLIEEASRAGAGPRIDRAAVLVRVDEHSVTPVALHGVDRLPWRDPVTAPGTPHDAWRRGEPVHSVRDPDRDGRRQGSAMLAIPLADRDDELLGLLVLERLVPQPMSPSEIEHVLSVCRRMAPQLHAALAFTELRHVSEVAERERLAREMHDGVAQDLSALGFAVDVAIKHVRERDDEAAQVLRDVRADLSRTIGDIRSSIADLRSSPRPERGLGAALSSHLQALGSTGALSVTTSLRESPFRLAAHVESVLLRLALDLVSHTRTDGTATALVTELATHPPRASLRMERTGGGSWVPDDTLVRALRSLGGDLVVVEEATRLVMRVEVGGRPFAPHAIIEDRGTIDVAGLEGSARRGRSDARLLGEEAVP